MLPRHFHNLIERPKTPFPKLLFVNYLPSYSLGDRNFYIPSSPAASATSTFPIVFNLIYMGSQS